MEESLDYPTVSTEGRIDPIDLVAGLFYFNPRLRDGWMSYNAFEERVLKKYGHDPLFRQVGIIPNFMHGTSDTFREAMMHFYADGSILFWQGDIRANPDSVLSIERYFDEISRKHMTDEQIKRIEEMSRSLFD